MEYQIWLREGLIAAVILLVAFMAGHFFLPLIIRLFESIARKTPTEIDNKILKLANRPLKLLIFLIAIFLITSRFTLTGRVKLITDGIIFVFAVYVIIKFIGQAWILILEWWGGRLKADDSQERFHREFLPLIKLLSWVFLYIFGIIITLKHFNLDVLSLIAALGVGSLAVGLAAKDTLANIISGFVILIDRPFRPGDRIQLENGTTGDVMTVGIRSTKIKTFDNNLLIIPNQNIMNSIVVNYAYPNSETRVVINVGVDYGSDVEKVKGLLVTIAASEELVLKTPEPKAYFVSFGDSALNMRLIAYVSRYSDAFTAQDRLNSMIHKEFVSQGVNIPFPIRTVHLTKEG